MNLTEFGFTKFLTSSLPWRYVVTHPINHDPINHGETCRLKKFLKANMYFQILALIFVAAASTEVKPLCHRHECLSIS